MSTHVLAIAKAPVRGIDGDCEWEIICERQTEQCLVWYPCTRKKCQARKPPWEGRDPGNDRPVIHGVEHLWIEGDWMTQSVRCATWEQDVSDYAYEIGLTHGVGAWPVTVSYEGDGQWSISPDVDPPATLVSVEQNHSTERTE